MATNSFSQLNLPLRDNEQDEIASNKSDEEIINEIEAERMEESERFREIKLGIGSDMKKEI